MIEPTTIPRKSRRTAARVVEGKALVVCIDDKQIHSLNEVGTRVWELCDGRSIEEIADVLVAEFEVHKSAALADVSAFVTDLTDRGALEVEGVP